MYPTPHHIFYLKNNYPLIIHREFPRIYKHKTENKKNIKKKST